MFTTSLWKSNTGYVFNLGNSLFWWANNLPQLFPNYNIRIYFDNSVFSGLSKDATEWYEIFEHILEYENIELWFYNCVGQNSNKCIGCHQGTFGSVVRFHAFDDPETEVVICHNLEYLTSPRDKERTELWLESGKQYHWYCFWTPKGQYGNVLEHTTEPTVIATFSVRKQQGEKMGYFSVELEQKYRDYPYGVDEYILTKLLKEKMTLENTFITDCMYDMEDIGELFEKRTFEYFKSRNNMSDISEDPDAGASWVLSKPSRTDRTLFDTARSESADALELLVREGQERAMAAVNTRG